MLICILTKNVITSCSVTMMLFLHLEVKPLMTLTTVLYLSCALISGHLAIDRKSGSAGMPRPNSYAVFCLKKKTTIEGLDRLVPYVGSQTRQILRSNVRRVGGSEVNAVGAGWTRL